MNHALRPTLPGRALTRLTLPAAAALTLVLSACGTGSRPAPGGHDMGSMSTMTSSTGGASDAAPPAGPTAASAHNDADATFAAEMIPHHAQAVQMADLALNRAGNPQVTSLAKQIRAAQDPEITTLSGWLTGWGKPVPDPTGGHDMSAMGGSMPGMMSGQEMDALAKATGTGFDRLWLQLMTKHHQGALSMARAELSEGANGQAKALARSIIDGQSAEFATMRSLLAGPAG